MCVYCLISDTIRFFYPDELSTDVGLVCYTDTRILLGEFESEMTVGFCDLSVLVSLSNSRCSITCFIHSKMSTRETIQDWQSTMRLLKLPYLLNYVFTTKSL